MLLFGGNPGGSDLERFSDLWRLDLQHDSHVITEVHNLIKICKYHYLLSQDKSSAACLYLRSLQHIGTDMKAQESFKKRPSSSTSGLTSGKKNSKILKRKKAFEPFIP